MLRNASAYAISELIAQLNVHLHLFFLSGVLRPLHGLLKLLSTVHGTAHRAVPEPSQLQSDSASDAVVAVETKHHQFH